MLGLCRESLNRFERDMILPLIRLIKQSAGNSSPSGSHAMIYRSLKMRSNANGSGNGYIYEKGDLIETESISAAEKEEFSALTEFVKSKLNNANA
jgi:hypothetical protein